MSKQGNWGSMTDRVAQSQPRTVEEQTPPPVALKHCWVTDDQGRLPALLLEWRRTAGGYQGRVVRPVLEPGMGWMVMEEWLPAELLAPA